MNATIEETKLLEKWQKQLGLQAWRIKLVTRLKPEGMTTADAQVIGANCPRFAMEHCREVNGDNS